MAVDPNIPNPLIERIDRGLPPVDKAAPPAPKDSTRVGEKEKTGPVKSEWYVKLNQAIEDAKAGKIAGVPPLADLPQGYPKIHCRFIKEHDFDPKVKSLTKKDRQESHYLAGTTKYNDKDYIKFNIYWEIELGNDQILSSDKAKTETLREKMGKPKAAITQIESFKDQIDKTFIQTTTEQPKLPDQKPEEATYINGATEDLNARRMALQVAKQYGNSLRFALGHGNGDKEAREAFINWFAKNNFIDIGLRDHNNKKITFANIGPDADAFGKYRRYHDISDMVVILKDENQNTLEYKLPPLFRTAAKIQSKVGQAQFSPYLGMTDEVRISEFGKLPRNLQARYEYQHFLAELRKKFKERQLENIGEQSRQATRLLDLLDSYEKDRTATLADAKYSLLNLAIRPQVVGQQLQVQGEENLDGLRISDMGNPRFNANWMIQGSNSHTSSAIAAYREFLKGKIAENERSFDRNADALKADLANIDVPFVAQPVKFSDHMSEEHLDGFKEYVELQMNDVFAEWHFLKCAMEGLEANANPTDLNKDFNRFVDSKYAKDLMVEMGTWRKLGRVFMVGFDDTKVLMYPNIPPPVPSFLGSYMSQGLLYPFVKKLGTFAVKLMPAKPRAWINSKFTPEAEAVKKAFNPKPLPSQVAEAGNEEQARQSLRQRDKLNASQKNQQLNFFDAHKRMVELQAQMFELILMANAINKTYTPDESKIVQFIGTRRQVLNTTNLEERKYQYYKMNGFNNVVERIMHETIQALEAEEEEELDDFANQKFFIKTEAPITPPKPAAAAGGGGGNPPNP